MKKCKICGEELIKEGRTEHYACRCAKKTLEQGFERVSESKKKVAIKKILKKPSLIDKLLKF